ncbi:DNA methyltransferase 1-associated protein 1 isoform X1 [Myripristis murdjan]|uniref:DNA methyltransferase 1-associated protein 1 isoform X1 n=1 Tax=Myripristis murdjan TaxID=586833 RepID=UPI001175EE25|nr:DNA methyltransferase 1-associated protein 1 isoform X1 [Myripristis murdjan]XP_029906347.1 DNA methyltransferase 1-associated protein 1 isoform X1 [Myripristis murdjan]
MATGADVRDILELGGGDNDAPISKKDFINSEKKKTKKTTETLTFKRPEGMHREVYALLYSDKKDAPPLLPSDTTQGYRTVKAKLGCKRVRPWKWMPFTNPARRDGAIFHHWRRITEEGKDYPFARFNKAVQVPVYSEQEYQMYLHDDGWTKAETDHLFDLCKRFDLRFIVVHDRYDHQQYRKRSVEDLKERYYSICGKLTKVRAQSGTEPKIYIFDAGHERRRKEQLEKLFNRTPEQVAEEEYLIQELRKIETRKKEREKKAQDLQKLIKAADTTTELRRAEKRVSKKKLPQKRETEKPSSLRPQAVPETAGIKFPDVKSAGVTLRSQRMKLPSSVGQKKIKAIEQILTEQGVDLNPMPTEEIVQMFNELRSDLVLVYELKQAHSNCEYEQQMLRHRYEALLKAGGGGGGGGTAGAGAAATPQTGEPNANNSTAASTPGGEAQVWPSADDIKVEAKEQIIDVVGAPLTPNSRKRRESASSSSSVKKVKKP